MSERLVWTCDGCGQEKVVSNSKSDWRRISVTFEGFEGYPVGSHADGRTSYELCPACQHRLHEVGRPRNWVRSEPAALNKEG